MIRSLAIAGRGGDSRRLVRTARRLGLRMAAGLGLAAPGLAPAGAAHGGRPSPRQDERMEVLATVRTVLAAIGSGDRRALMATVRAEGGATAAFDLPGRHRIGHLSWAEFATSIGGGPDVVAERLIEPKIAIDDDIAMVWSRYVFTVNGRPQHCGADHFDLIREAGTWKVLNASWSERVTGCGAR